MAYFFCYMTLQILDWWTLLETPTHVFWPKKFVPSIKILSKNGLNVLVKKIGLASVVNYDSN